MESSGTGGLRTRTQLIAIIALLVVVLIVGAALIWVFFQEEENDLNVGDFLRYEVTGAYEGDLWINVTAANDTVVEIVSTWCIDNQTVVNDPILIQMNDTYLVYITYHSGIPLEDLQGGEVMETVFGEREVDHYRITADSELIHDFYCSLEGGVVYRHTQNGEEWGFEAVLVETNIDWV